MVTRQVTSIQLSLSWPLLATMSPIAFKISDRSWERKGLCHSCGNTTLLRSQDDHIPPVALKDKGQGLA